MALMFRSGNMWRLMGQYFASNFTFFFCLTWLLPHLTEKYGLSTGRAGWYAMLPLLAGMVGNWVGGGLVDGMYRKGRWTALAALAGDAGLRPGWGRVAGQPVAQTTRWRPWSACRWRSWGPT